MQILLVAAPAAALDPVERLLVAEGHVVRRTGPPEALVLVDARGGDPACLWPWAGQAAVVALLDDPDPAAIRRMIEAGARDWLPLPVDPAVWRQRLPVLEAAASLHRMRARREEADRVMIRQLQEGSRRFELVARATNDAVYDWDVKLGTIVWNEALDAVLGGPVDRATAGLDWWSASIHPDDRGRVMADLDRAVAEKEMPWLGEYRFRRLNGEYAHVLDRGLMMYDADGAPSRMIGVMMDVTARKVLQEQLVLADRMASVGTLAAGVAHEINNPLTWLLARTSQAVELTDRLPRGPLAEALADALRDANSGAVRIRDIVRDLRIFARAEDDVDAPIDVRRVMNAAASIAAAELRHRARLVRDFAPVPFVRGNEARLGQVMLNLVLNAVQAIPDGKPDAHTITLSTRVDADGLVCASVTDTGMGVPPELRARIFDPFFTTKPVGEGTGLGLAISRQLVGRMGGEILLESAVGAGTRFTVRLPACDDEPPTGPRTHPIAPPLRPRRGRVLLIDDEARIVSFLSRVLEAEYDVVGLTRASEALALLRRGEQFDVILCDLMMPELTGEQFYRALQAENSEHAMRTIFITGGAFTARTRAFLDEVKGTLVEKPFEVQSLRELIRGRIA